ncbi:MAG: glycosyltransferase [Pantoea dispersa]|jgi:GT2 family glycosyltransferase|nr:glycosyltransferase [Pantoea dispersa]MBZ6392670.1 glycosyltransferase [Pantoea dispersa]
MKENKLVSIIIPAYKGDFFELSLQSAVQQDYPAVEIIVCDDSDSDLISNVVRKYQNTTPVKISYYKNEQRLQEIGNVRRCLSLSNGEYVKFLYDDDILRKDCVSKLMKAFTASSDIVLASSRRQRINEQGDVLPDIMATAYPFRGDVIIEGRDLIAFLSDYIINFIGEPSCVLCRRQDLVDLGDELFFLNGKRMRYLGDVAIYVNLLSKGNFAFLSEPLSQFRISEQQVSQMAASDQEAVATTYQQFPLMIEKLGWYKGDHITNQTVRASALTHPGNYIECNLLAALSSALHLSGGSRANKNLGDWLKSREITKVQSAYIENHLSSISINNVVVYVLAREADNENINVTLDSLEKNATPGLIVHPVLINANLTDFTSIENLKNSDLNEFELINQHLSEATVDWVLILKAGSILTGSGLLQMSFALPDAKGCAAVYADELYHQSGEVTGSSFRPDFNLDLLLSHPAEMARHWLYNRNVLLNVGGFDPAYHKASEFELIIRLVEQYGINSIGHLPEPLVISESFLLTDEPEYQDILKKHLHRRGYTKGWVKNTWPGLYSLRYEHANQPLVSIIIPTKDQLPVLITCVTSLLEKTHYKNYEIIVVDNNSESAEAQQWLAGLAEIDPKRIRVLSYPHPFNYSAINNFAAREARGEYLVLLNNDTAIISENWLDELLNHAQRPEVGIVGAKLLYPDGRVQHAGVILGLRGPAEHPFIGEAADAPGYMRRLLVDQNYAAVTAACLMIRAEIYREVGGLNEEDFKVSYNDVDLCLKVRESGYLTVWTPHAVVMHEGSVSQKRVDKTTQEKKIRRFTDEQDAFYRRWMPLIANDPAYNANLSLNGNGFELEQGDALTWRPLSWKPMPVITALMADFTGCGQYRIIQPLNAMISEGLVEGRLTDVMQHTSELARYAPDSIVLQRQITPESHEWLNRLKVLPDIFKVFELDDYLPNLPMKSIHREHMPKDILKSIRKSLSLVDRFIVSTSALADAFSGAHADIRVVENRLPPAIWGNLTSLRGQSKKPRVGWAGGSSHTGDLEMIYDVVKTLSDRVEWVFFGMCPAKLRPYIHEYHQGVEIKDYPEKLASLNLDLALAPVEDNLFNRCKSNLRLLEYGACGFPVIASDVECYRYNLPVTLVRNRYKDWIEAIEMHLNDRDTSWLMGDALREAVRSDWLLTGEPLRQWAKLWLPD